jgi:hypothetical protein
LPLIWFQGDVKHLEPGNWALVMSLNHQLPASGGYAGVNAESMWDLQRRHHRDNWYESFFGPLTRVAAAGLGRGIEGLNLAAFASNRVVFTELCPYASKFFALGTQTVADLVQSELGFQTAARIRSVFLEEARPALVLVNGSRAIEAFEAVYRAQFSWRLPRVQYVSADVPRPGRGPKTLWHIEGIYESASGPITVLGFPFLRKPRTHNSFVEIAQLGDHARRAPDRAVRAAGADESMTSG